MAQQTEADDVSTELKEAVNSAKGTALAYGSSAPFAKQAADGRWFVRFSTSHGYGRSNALEAAREVLPEMEMAYNPHGARQWLAERHEADRMERDEAEALVQEGLVYVNPRGYTAEITGISATGHLDVAYPDSEFGDSTCEGKDSRLVDYLVDGICTVLEDPREDEQEDEDREVRTDGGYDSALEAERSLVAEQAQHEYEAEDEADENPHQHTSVWAAAQNLEQHEDGSAPRVGVEYRKKNGQGTARKAGTVERVEVNRPDSEFDVEAGHPVPRIVFQRDDGQRMYVEPDGLYTVGSHAPYVGATVALTTSTTSTVEVPEASGRSSDDSEQEADDERGQQATGHVPVPDILGPAQRDAAESDGYHSVGQAYVSELAAWARTQEGLHGTSGSTHYSWDIPGFGRRNDPHNGFTAKSGGECVYAVIEGDRSEAQEKALAKLASRDGLEASVQGRRVVLVPGQDLGQ